MWKSSRSFFAQPLLRAIFATLLTLFNLVEVSSTAQVRQTFLEFLMDQQKRTHTLENDDCHCHDTAWGFHNCATSSKLCTS